ncbi:cysteine hydrolase family protein [Sphingomonas sp. ASY06-1R]|jgi:nicotinamidase-related amidase|uniref:cysteine hydrolase family protein n=1 Tax=Sphingomonas sp. ASY06-1R TaxID=3445771 RepID=UPI003FA233FE
MSRNRRRLSTIVEALSVALAASIVMPTPAAFAQQPSYADPSKPALKRGSMVLDPTRAALIVIDPQNDFMDPRGKAWPVVSESVTEQQLIPHLTQLLTAAKAAGMMVAISPHHYYHWDHQWRVQGPLEIFQHDAGVFDRAGPYTSEGFEGSGADFLPAFKPFIFDGKTVIASPHKLYGPQVNDLAFQLRKQRIDQVIIVGMLANMCVESHVRQLLEEGFEVAVVRDAIAAPKLPEGDGYLAALINFRYMANGLWTTDQAVQMMRKR